MNNKNELKAIIDETIKSISSYSERTGHGMASPYPSDSPCYYCQFNEHSWDSGRQVIPPACKFCIHNAENILLEVLSDD